MTTENDSIIHPFSASASGQNAYNLDNCDKVGHRPPYASCLFKINEFDHGRLGSGGSCGDCKNAMSAGTCPAQAMRKEEEIKGRSIYYIDRAELRKQNQNRDDQSADKATAMLTADRKTAHKSISAAEKRTASAPSYAPQPQTARHTPEPSGFTDEADGYAAAINRAMKEATAPIVMAPKPTAPAANFAKPGMSMVEIARAAMARANA